MEVDPKKSILPPIAPPRPLNRLGSTGALPKSNKDDGKVTLDHAIFEMEATYKELKKSFDDFKYELDTGNKKSNCFEKYSGIIEEIHNDLPLLRGQDISNSITIGDHKKLQENGSGEERKNHSYKKLFSREKELLGDEGRFSAEYLKQINKELHVIAALDKEIEVLENRLKDSKAEKKFRNKPDLFEILTKLSEQKSESKLFREFFNFENPTKIEEINKSSSEKENDKELEDNVRIQKEDKEKYCVEKTGKTFINRNIALAKNHSTISLSLTDEEKSKLEMLLTEIDDNEKQEDREPQMPSVCTTNEANKKDKEYPHQTSGKNAFRILDEDRDMLEEIQCKLNNIVDSACVKLEENVEVEGKVLEEEEKQGKYWKQEKEQKRLDQIEQKLALIAAEESKEASEIIQDDLNKEITPDTKK